MRTSQKLTFYLLFGLLISCVEPFGFQALDFEQVVVVEGRFTDQKCAHYVKLSHTRPVDEEDGLSPITGAEVWVEDQDGNRINFEESASGLYESDSSVAGVVGQHYQLLVTLTDGSRYQSDVQELLASPPIDSIYDEYKERIDPKTDALVGGIQFFLDTHDDTGVSQFYKYEWEETYEVRAPYPSRYKFVDLDDGLDTAVLRDEQVSICYVTRKSTDIILGSTANLTSDRLAGLDLRYITSSTDELKIAYSLLAKQYSISAPAYTYYRRMVANNEETGSLFDQQLGAVVGNVYSIENRDETVLGFFEVSGVTEKRTFVTFDELDSRFPWPEDRYPCAPTQVVYLKNSRDSMTYYVKAKGYEVIYAEFCDTARVVPPGGLECPFESRIDMAPVYCVDCRFRGTNVKPEFWIY